MLCVPKPQYESIAWRRRRFERQAVLREIMGRIGDNYSDHFQRRVSIVEMKRNSMAADGTLRQRLVSVVSPESLWFNNLYWFRVLLAINTLVACMMQVGTLAPQHGSAMVHFG